MSQFRRSLSPRRAGSRWTAALLLGLLCLGSCAIANRGTLQLSRHVSVGQELLDLKRARDEGAITAEEYLVLKSKIMKLADSHEFVDSVDDFTPDRDRD